MGYRPGETIAIKVNFNNTSNIVDTDNHADASPQAVLALLRQLVHKAGVAQSNIVVYEAPNTPPRRVIPNRAFDRWSNEFPRVVYAHCTNVYGRTLVTWATNVLGYSVTNGCGRNLPTIVTAAKYLIHMALLKGHSTAGVTLTAKNHYGSINQREHTFINVKDRGMGTYSPFVDLMGSPHLGGKTLLYMIDGLYGTRNVGSMVGTDGRWNNLFGGQWSASFFLSLDPVAIDSVAVDLLWAEFGNGLGDNPRNCDNYLHEAALAHAPPSGVVYTNQFGRLSSLGVHEHWDNAVQRLYSRNLGTGDGIELVANTDANLTITLRPMNSPVAGYRHRYILIVSNAGPAIANSAIITNTWPAGARLVQAVPSQGTWTTNDSNQLLVQLGSIPVSRVATVEVAVLFPAYADGTATNLATVGANERDAWWPDNSWLATTHVQADSDGDGMPDNWEQACFGHPTHALPWADPDADGVGNLHEYLAGTDPSDPSSVLKVIGRINERMMELTWPCVEGKVYQIQYCDTLDGEWHDVPGAWCQASPGQTNLLHRLHLEGIPVPRFYRARLVEP